MFTINTLWAEEYFYYKQSEATGKTRAFVAEKAKPSDRSRKRKQTVSGRKRG